MRGPRCRRLKRSQRKFSKEKYTESAVIIQKCFRKFLSVRYEGLCLNSRDDECIMLQPVSDIPRGVLVVVDDMAFDSRHLLAWMTRSDSHPLTREPLPDRLKHLCVDKAVVFLTREQKRISNRKGYFSRKRTLKRTLDRHADLAKCKRRRTRFSE